MAVNSPRLGQTKLMMRRRVDCGLPAEDEYVGFFSEVFRGLFGDGHPGHMAVERLAFTGLVREVLASWSPELRDLSGSVDWTQIGAFAAQLEELLTLVHVGHQRGMGRMATVTAFCFLGLADRGLQDDPVREAVAEVLGRFYCARHLELVGPGGLHATIRSLYAPRVAWLTVRICLRRTLCWLMGTYAAFMRGP